MNVQLGHTITKFGERPFFIDLDRSQFRHALLLGKSGTGKSTLLRNLLVEAIRHGLGVAVVDPHGDLVFDILNYIPEHRLKHIVYIDPESDRAPDLGLFDHPDKERAVQAFMSLMEAHSGRGWGPETAHILRGATDAVLELVPRPTIGSIYKILARASYAEKILSKTKNPLVRDFYTQYFEELKPQERARNFSHPLNKIEELLRPGLREFLCQKRPLNFVKLMDEQKILLCRIPKGIMGERPAKVLGSLILSKINLASFRRKKRNKQFVVVADEFHNFTDGIDVETMFAEARKCGVQYVVTSQTTAQLRDEERRVFNDRIVFGNASHFFAFRTSGDDADDIAVNFGDKDIAESLVKLPNFEFVAWVMQDHQPELSTPVTLLAQVQKIGNEVPARKAASWARENTGTPKGEIEKHITEALRV